MSTRPWHLRTRLAALRVFALATALAACGGGDKATAPTEEPPPIQQPPVNNPASAAVAQGDEQVGEPGTAVPIAPAVIVRDGNGNPMKGIRVNFAVTAGGGSITGATAQTGDDGIARVGSWTLGAAGENTLDGTVTGLATPVRFRATAQPVTQQRQWTVLVYMAADNNLAVAGIFDIDEMESAARNPNVQVVVQAEFSPEALAQQNCDFQCFNRPNWNTFRYAITGGGQETTGPNGDAIDIGNRNMVDPAELREFIEWGKQNYPAQHYAVVLWNHGGGYSGLLQDLTSGGSDLMSLAELRTALTATGPVDLLAFDMCLMAGYETLADLDGLAKYVVFSEEVVPGEGFPYKEVVEAINANATSSGREIAGSIADAFHAGYANSQPSTTISAYDMAGFQAFENALQGVADGLEANVTPLGSDIGAAAGGSQKYTYRELTDLVDFLDRLSAQPNGGVLQGSIAALKAQLTGNGFRIRSHARNGTNVGGQDGAADVTRSNGLHIVLPSGGEDDRLQDGGPRSFAAYQAAYPDKPWTRFLDSWLNGATGTTVTDQGDSRFDAFLVWDENAVAAGADVDLWILEPDGNIYSPVIGTVTPNGSLTPDSYEKDTYYEGYLTNRFVQNGTYVFIANLYADPNDFRPLYDFVHRTGQTSEFESEYDPDYPQLSTERSWKDGEFSADDLINGVYTDLQIAYAVRFGPPTVAQQGRQGGSPSLGVAQRGVPGATLNASASVRKITSAQLATLRRALAEQRNRSTSLRPGSAALSAGAQLQQLQPGRRP
jgi:hypothetical protein